MSESHSPSGHFHVAKRAQAIALDLYYMRFTHGLPGSIVLSLVFGAIVGPWDNALASIGERRRQKGGAHEGPRRVIGLRLF